MTLVATGILPGLCPRSTLPADPGFYTPINPAPLYSGQPPTTLLDGPESIVPSIPAHPGTIVPLVCSRSSSFRHGSWLPLRTRTFRVLQRVGVPAARVERFRACGSGGWVWSHPSHPGRYRITSDHCRDRWCVPCSRARSARIASTVAGLLRGTQSRLVTLTLRASADPLAAVLDRLYDCFRKLRRLPIWSGSVNGCVYFTETTRGRSGEHWHVHIHAIVTGRYLPQRQLSDAWRTITTDSHIVDVRLIRDADQAAQYVAKYATKAVAPSVTHSDDWLAEAILALSGRRLCGTTGCFRGVRLDPESDSEDLLDSGWLPIARLEDVLRSADAGDVSAIAFLARIKEGVPCPTNKSPPL